jgi:hypothetical protein
MHPRDEGRRNVNIPKSRMWGPQVRFRERGPLVREGAPTRPAVRTSARTRRELTRIRTEDFQASDGRSPART